jgi:hypothetical protein
MPLIIRYAHSCAKQPSHIICQNLSFVHIYLQIVHVIKSVQMMVGGNVKYFINTTDLKYAGCPKMKNPLGVKGGYRI